MSEHVAGHRETQAERHADGADPPQQRSSIPPSTQSHAVLRLQQTAGNAATAAWLQRAAATAPAPPRQQAAAEPAVQRLAKPGDVDAAVMDLHEALVLKNVAPVEAVLQTILLQKDQRQAVRQKYTDTHHRDLMQDLERLGGNDTIRGQRYLEYGTLRPADKLYFTISGWGVDMTTMDGVLGRLHGELISAEDDFSNTYSKQFGNRREKLPNNTESSIAAAIVDHMINASFSLEWELTKAKALLAYGTLRPADRVRIAVSGRLINETEMLVGALSLDPNVGNLKKAYRDSYGEELAATLDRETSRMFKERDVANALLDENRAPAQRVVEVIRIATSGLMSAPEFIWQVLGNPLLDPGPVKTAVQEGLEGKGELKDIADTFGGLGAEDLDRLKAMLGIGGTGILADKDVQDLQKAGGTGSGSVFETLKLSVSPNWEKFKAAYQKPNSPFERYVSMYCAAAEKGWLGSQVFADTKARINWTFENPGNTDYLVHIIANFTDSTTRRELARDRTFMTKVKELGTANANRVLIVLAPSDMTPLEKANWLNEAVGRETPSGVGSVTNAADAVNDENRELQAAIGRAKATGKPLTDDQLKEINALVTATEGALQAFIKYRDELESIVDSVVAAAVGLVLALATGGASVEFAAAAIARAAIASAMAKVVTKKVVMGDRFDVLGADGAGAFVSGAVDGALNVISGVITAGAATEALKEAAGGAVRAAAPNAFRTFAADTGKKMLESAVTGGLSAAIETASRDETWAQGGDNGLKHILHSSFVNAAISAGVTGAASAIMAGVRWNERLGQLRSLPPEEQRALVGQAIDAEGVGATLRKTGHSAEQLRDLMGAETPAGRRISEYLSSGVGTLDGPAIKERLTMLDREPIGNRGPLVQQAIDVLGPPTALKNLPSWEMVTSLLGAESQAMVRLTAWRDGLAARAEAWAFRTALTDPVPAVREYLAKAAGCEAAALETALGLTVSLAMAGGQPDSGVGVEISATGGSVNLVDAVKATAPTPVSKLPVSTLPVQRSGPGLPPIPPPPTLAPGLAGFSGTDFELAVAHALEAGTFAKYGLPAMRVVPGIHNDSGNGIDLLGVSRNGSVVTFWVIECKFVREGGSWEIKLGRTKSGIQLSNDWIRQGLTELLEGDGVAEENQAELRGILREAYGRDYRASMLTETNLLVDYILENARRHVIVPEYSEQARVRLDAHHINVSEGLTGHQAVHVTAVKAHH